jgi:hypothetical protein
MNQIQIQNHKERVSRAHPVGRSMALTLDPNLVRIFGITTDTYIKQKVIDGRIVLEMFKLEEVRMHENTNHV